jgi:hypothetical protein
LKKKKREGTRRKRALKVADDGREQGGDREE